MCKRVQAITKRLIPQTAALPRRRGKVAVGSACHLGRRSERLVHAGRQDGDVHRAHPEAERDRRRDRRGDGPRDRARAARALARADLAPDGHAVGRRHGRRAPRHRRARAEHRRPGRQCDAQPAELAPGTRPKPTASASSSRRAPASIRSAAVSLWEKMGEASGGGQPPKWLSTHPPHEDRINDLRIRAEGDAALHSGERQRSSRQITLIIPCFRSGNMGQTLYDKLWDSHVVHVEEDGTALLYIDRHLVHEVTSPQAYEGLRAAGRKPWRIDSVVATADHNTPTTDWDQRHRRRARSDGAACRSRRSTPTCRSSAPRSISRISTSARASST